MRWKLPQQYEHIGRPSLSLRRRTRLSHRRHRKKLQEPPLGKRRCSSRTSRLSSIAPKPIQTLVISAVIVPSARSRETLAETGSVSGNNLCVTISVTIPPGHKERTNETDEPSQLDTSWAHFTGPYPMSPPRRQLLPHLFLGDRAVLDSPVRGHWRDFSRWASGDGELFARIRPSRRAIAASIWLTGRGLRYQWRCPPFGTESSGRAHERRRN